MRKFKGEYIFTDQNLWSLGCTFSNLIYCGLKQFRAIERSGAPGGLEIDGLWYISVEKEHPYLGQIVEETVKGKLSKTKYITYSEMEELWNKILDDMILAFKMTINDTDGIGYLISVTNDENDDRLNELYFLTDDDKKISKEYGKRLCNHRDNRVYEDFRKVSEKVENFIVKGRENFARYMHQLWD